MDFALAYMKSKQKFLLRNFTSSAPAQKGRLLDWEEIGNWTPQGLIFPEEFKEDRQFMEELEHEGRYMALRSSGDLQLSLADFEALEHTQAKEVWEKIRHRQVLISNLALLEELFPTLEHFKNLYPDDRTTFFEEIWFFLKKNLGAKDLRVIYNDAKKREGPSEKDRLVQVIVEGERYPASIPGEKVGRVLMNEYEKYFGSYFEVIEYNQESSHMAAVAHVNKGPLIIIAQVLSLSKLQKILLKTFFEGLEDKS